MVGAVIGMPSPRHSCLLPPPSVPRHVGLTTAMTRPPGRARKEYLVWPGQENTRPIFSDTVGTYQKRSSHPTLIATMPRLAHVLASVLPLAAGVAGTCKIQVDPAKIEGDMKSDG